jgi:hypothetical protein
VQQAFERLCAAYRSNNIPVDKATRRLLITLDAVTLNQLAAHWEENASAARPIYKDSIQSLRSRVRRLSGLNLGCNGGRRIIRSGELLKGCSPDSDPN